jgi:hypothetical protein
MEKTSYDRLDYIVPNDGILSINVAEERDETAYLDKVNLIAVDHPKGTEVMMDEKGTIHTISNPLSVECIDESGDDCTFEVSTQDAMPPVRKLHEQGGMIKDTDYKGKAWESDEIDSVYTYLELTLPETNEKTGKLVVSLSETGILSASERYFYSLAEGHLHNIHDLLDSTLMGNVIAQKIYTLASPRVQIVSEGGWIDYPEAGTHIEIHYDSVLFVLDMDEVQDNKIRLKVWKHAYMIDYITIDYTPDLEVRVNELSPDYDILSEIDENYEVMGTGDTVILNYAEPELVEDLDRTYFVSFTGYYHPLQDLSVEDLPGMLDPMKADTMYKMLFKDGYAEEYLLAIHTGIELVDESFSQSGSLMSILFTVGAALVGIVLFYSVRKY